MLGISYPNKHNFLMQFFFWTLVPRLTYDDSCLSTDQCDAFANLFCTSDILGKKCK